MNDNVKLSVRKTHFYVIPNKNVVGCKLDYELRGDQKFLSTINNFIQTVKDPIAFNVTAEAHLDPLDHFDVETGKKVARAKAESMAYDHIWGLMDRFMAHIAMCMDQSNNMIDRASDVISHNSKYLKQF